jgi:hypothetical protein
MITSGRTGRTVRQAKTGQNRSPTVTFHFAKLLTFPACVTLQIRSSAALKLLWLNECGDSVWVADINASGDYSSGISPC